jgi:hypothetical protein
VAKMFRTAGIGAVSLKLRNAEGARCSPFNEPRRRDGE